MGAHRRQEALCEFKANLVKKGSSRTARAVTQRNPVSINKTKQNKTKQKGGKEGEREGGRETGREREESEHFPFSRGFQTLTRELANPKSPSSIPQAKCPWKNSTKVPRATHPLSGCCSVIPAVLASSEGNGLLHSCEKHRLDLPSSALLAKVDFSVNSPPL